MDRRIEYHRSRLSEYGTKILENSHVDIEVLGEDGVVLNATEIVSESAVGIIIIPGLTVPRESYYKLLIGLSDFNAMVFDLRGQSFSEGKLDAGACINDINSVGKAFKKRKNLTFLVGIGHSFGGLSLLRSSMESDHPYDLRISLATPVDLAKITGRIPYTVGIIAVYLHNMFRALRYPALRDEIVRQYEHFNPILFFNSPRVVALNIKDPHAFNNMRRDAPKLNDILQDIKSPSYLLYGGNDNRLGIAGNLKGDYERLARQCVKRGIEIIQLEGLSHKFNREKENKFVIAYNNNVLIDCIKEIFEAHNLRNYP